MPDTAVLVDYGAGNLRSAARALERAGARVVVTDDPAVIEFAHDLEQRAAIVF